MHAGYEGKVRLMNRFVVLLKKAVLCIPIIGATFAVTSTPVLAGNCVIEYIGTELLDYAKFCSSSELKSQGVGSYGPENLGGRDSNAESGTWCEGAKGDGISEWISVNISPQMPIKTLWIGNGYQKSKKAFTRNSRVKRALIETGNGNRFKVTLSDTRGVQNIYFPDWEDLGTIRLTILSVHPGSHYKDTCVSLLWPDAEEMRELEFQKMNE